MSPLSLGIEEIDKKYEVLEKMGEGGMGAIYKVRHRLLEEVRVVKTIRAQLREEQDHQARFLREAKVATQLRHPGIAQTYDFGIDDEGSAYIVMEFIDGTDLAELMASGRRPDQAEALDIADQTLEILAYLHGERFVHRDISPDNIMLVRSEDGRLRVKLIDLGIAKPLEASQQFTRTGMFVGKLRYASPEQLGSGESKTVEAQSDLYAFGLVLYELLTGRFPIQGDSEAAILAGHLLHPPRSFDETDPDAQVPEAVRTTVLRALEKSPVSRWASAQEFRQALAAAASGVRPAAARRPAPAVTPPPGRSPRPTRAAGKTVLAGRPAAARRWPRPSARQLGIGAAAALLVAAGLAVWQSGVLVRPEADGRADAVPPLPGPRGGPPPPEGAGLAELDFGAYHALVIGNNRYEKLPRLESAVADAEEMASLLERRYGFQVTLLTDATRHQIITALTEITEGLSARDNLLLFYAGHGWLDEQNQSGYWQPIDADPFNTANWISTRHEISAVLGRTPARQVLVVADSCYAGSLAEIGAAAPEPIRPGPEHLAQVRELLSRRARLALTSGGLSPVLDQGGGRHSIFSKALLEVLGGNARVAEVSRLFGEIESRMSRAAARYGIDQEPNLAPIAQAGDEGGEFFFVPAAPSA